MKRLRPWFLLFPILLSVISSSLLLIPAKTVQADALPNLAVICDSNANNSSDIHVENGEYSLGSHCVTVEILSRAKIRLVLPQDMDRRLSPLGSNVTKLGIFAGTYNRGSYDRLLYDDNDTVSQISLSQVGGVGNNENLQSETLYKRWDVLDDSEIRKLFENAQYQLIADNQGDEVGNADFCESGDSTDNYIGLQKEKRYWDCFGTGIPDAYKFDTLKENLIGALNNFNITHTASDDGKKLVSVFEDDDVDRDSFYFCETGAYQNSYALRDCEDPREGYTIAATPASFQNANSTLVTVEAPGKTTFRIRIGGSTSASAQSNLSSASNLNGGVQKPSCESEGGEWSWLLCPALRIVSGAMEKVDDAIQELLSVPPAYYDNENLESAWRRIRNIAYIILIPVMLVMVISTALGFEFISAYTVKKALPRLLIAVIFMTLSFEITKFLIIITNNISQGIQGLIISSFNGQSDVKLASLFDPGGATGAVFTGSLGAGLIVAAGLLPVVLSYLFVSLIALFIALLALSLRQMLLIMFMVLAPLAIIAWIFPGNDKLWKLWWGTFSKLLLLFPLIMILIGSGKAFAALVQDTNSDVFATVLKLTAYVGPYFFIPAMFKFAGGIFATVSGMANDRSKGLFDRQRKYRSRKYGEGFERAKEGNYFKGGTESNLRGRLLNKGVQGGALINRAGANPLKMGGRLGAAMSDSSIAGREKMLEDHDYTWKGNDDLNKAAYKSNDEASLRRNLIQSGNYANTAAGRANMERDVAKVERMRRKYGNSAFKQATWLQAAGGGTAHDTGVGSDNVWQGAASVAGNDDAVLADLVAKGRSSMMNAGRVDEAGAGWMDTFKIARQFRDNPKYTADQGRADLAKRVYDSQGGGILVHSSMKAGAVENLAPEMVRTVDDAVQSGDTRAAAQSLASLSAVYDGMAASSPEKARIMADKVMSQELDIATLTPDMKKLLGPALLAKDPATGALMSRTSGKITMQQAIEGVRASENNGDFLQMRREYQSQIANMQAQQAQQQGPGGPPTQAPTQVQGP